MKKQIFRLLCFCSVMLIQPHVDAQIQLETQTSEIDIFALMERTDLPLDEIERLAKTHFSKIGTGRGTGYKQFQRWLYERKFHVDESGYFVSPNIESASYKSFMRNQVSTSRSVEPWADLGPTSWSATSGWNPGVGRITSVAIHPSNEDVIYVSSPGGGIWKSSDGGNTWSPLLDDINAAWMYVYNIRIDPGNQNTIYAAVMSGGVIKSTNAGSTWSATGSGPSNTRKVVVHPTNSNIVLATAANGIWRSTDGGTAWTQVNTGTAEDIEFKPGNADIVYVSGNTNNIRRSTNNGVSWTVIGAAGGITHSGRTLLGVTPDNPSIVYAVQANVSVFGRMYKSSDSGLNYVTTVVGDPAMGTNFFGYDPLGMDNLGQAGYDMAICVNPVNEDEVHIAGIICWKSTNGGFNFTSETDWDYPNGIGYNHADVHALEWVNSTIYSGSDGGIYQSTNNGDDWVDLSSGLGIRQIYRLSQAMTNPAILLIGSQDNGSSYRQSSGDWIDWLGADGMDNMISPTNPNIAYGTSNGQTEFLHGQLYKTTDGGLTRTDFNEPSNGEWITPVDMHPTDHDHIYVGWTGVWESTDGGTSWTNISTGFIDKKINTLVVAASNVNHIYASVSDTLYRTTNGGTTWNFVTMASDVTSVFVSSTDPAKIWVTLNATSNQVLFSTNGGTNFTSISGGLPALSARTVVVDENDADGVYVGLNIGVYYRNDDEPAWIPFGTELPLVAINELEIHETSGKIRVATYGRGVWENDLSNSTGGDCPEYAYVPNNQSNTVSVVALPANTLVTTINVGTNPGGVCHTSTADKVFITNYGSNNVSVITTSNNQVVATVALPANASPSSIDITPDDAFVYVTNAGNGTVTVINTSTHAIVQTITVGGEPTMVQVSPDGTKAYVTDYDLRKIYIINTTNYSLGTPINLSNYPLFVRFTPDGTLAFVLTLAEELYMINATTNTLIDSLSFPFGYYSTALCMSPSGEKLYCGFYDDTPGPGLGVVDVSSFTIETYATGFCCGVGGLSTSGDGSLLYVTNPSYNKVSVINTATNAFISSFNVGSFPTGRGDFVVNCEDMGGGPTVCGTQYYDSGGPTGEYSDDEFIIDILCPDNPEDAIELTFTAFATENGYDFLKIFDGNSISAPPLHIDDGFSGTTLPGTFTSTHATGCLTVQFTSDGSNTDSGWEASVDCVPMGTNPPCDEFAYVPNSFLNTISVIDLQTLAPVDTIPVSDTPKQGCHSNDGSTFYFLHQDSDTGGSVSVISTATNTVIDEIEFNSPEFITSTSCISPDDTRLYVSLSSIPPGMSKWYVIDAATNTIITSLNIGGTLLNMAVTPDGSRVYASNNRRDSVWVFNTTTNTVLTKIKVVDDTYGLAISPDGSKVFVSTHAQDLQIISTATNTVIGSVDLPGRAYGLCFSLDGEKIYTANSFIDSVSVVDVNSLTLESNILVGDSPRAININSDGSKLYVFNNDSEDVSVIETASNIVISTFEAGESILSMGDYVLNCATSPPPPPLLCGTLYYDSGGPNGFYSSNENNIDTLCPDDPADKIQLEFLIFSVENTYDYLKIFDGPSIASPPLHTGSGFTGTILPGTFISTHSSGCLTTQFTSDVSVVDTGWVAEVTCVGGICESDFYDTGGPSATYGPDEDVVTTLCPGSPDEAIHVEFLTFLVEANYDALYVFDGPTVTSPIFPSGNGPTNSGFPADGYYGSTLPGPFTSSDQSGCLTFQFLSDGSLEYAGWSAAVTCLPRPENDLCENAILIGCNQTVVGTNVMATSDIEEFCGSFPGAKGVWYKIIGNGESITLTTCDAATDFDTQIHVYTGTCSVYECIAQNDDDPLCNESFSSTLSFPSLVGEEYYVLISGYQQNEGVFTLETSCSSGPIDNNCLHFDGVNDNVYGASNALFELVDGTIELWVRPETKATSQTFLSYRNDAGSATRYLFNFLGNLNGLGFWNGSAYSTFTYVFTPNQWYHLAFVDDGTNTKIYINGEYAGAFTIQFSGASGPQLHLVLGYDIPLSEYFKGSIDEVRIWSGALSESTIAANMSCGVSASEDCLVAYYRFNQGIPAGANGSVTTLLDETGNNLDATLLNFALSGSTSNWLEATNGVAGNCTFESCPSDVILSLSILQDCLLFGEDTLEYYPTWTEEFGLLGNTSNGTITLDPADGNWSSSNTNVATIVDGHLEAIGPGTATISVAMAGVMTGTAVVHVIAPVLNPVYNAIPASLASPNNLCAVKDMPVIIIRYLPTTDGVNLDVAHAPDYFDLGEITLEQMELNLAALDDRIRFALEEGTRFRDYGQDTVSSYLGYRVVEMITVYEPTPRGPLRTYDVNGLPIFEIDFHSVFERFDIEHYVNTLGVKEVWFWQYGMESGYPSYDPEIHFPCNFRFAWESNMASPVTADISNSNQDITDLPIYDRTYIVYGQNIRRSQAEAIHNHGHQLERMIPHMNYLQDGNTLLFWRDFVGQDEEQNFTTGRCGWTHMPPNTTTPYDYLNLDIIFSDIMDWTPSGGSQYIVNADVWGTMNYQWPGAPTFPQKTESQWYVFWMQSFPGNNNLIEYESDYMTNWWDIIADWDLAIANGLGLYSNTPASNTMQNEVVTTSSTGYGSLRSTIACAPSGSTITFSPFLVSDTLDILTPIVIDKTIHLDGTSYPGLFLDASPSTFVFDILNTGILDLESMYIKCGTNTLQSGLRNYGDTELINMIFKTNLNSPIINNRNFLSLTGANTILRN